ncbi:hypothetical protein CBL_03989 [Carabus blaptoides fortunei]
MPPCATLPGADLPLSLIPSRHSGLSVAVACAICVTYVATNGDLLALLQCLLRHVPFGLFLGAKVVAYTTANEPFTCLIVTSASNVPKLLMPLPGERDYPWHDGASETPISSTNKDNTIERLAVARCGQTVHGGCPLPTNVFPTEAAGS